MDNGWPPGFEVPVFRSLYEPNLIGGVRRELAALLWIATAVITSQGGLRAMWWMPLLAGALHAGAAIATRHDADFLAIVVRAMRAPRRLEP